MADKPAPAPTELDHALHERHLRALAEADAALDSAGRTADAADDSSAELPNPTTAGMTKSFAFWATEHLRISGVYWALAAADALGGGCLDRLLELTPPGSDGTPPATGAGTDDDDRGQRTAASPGGGTYRERIRALLSRCQDVEGSGGFAGNDGHDAHLLYTLSAVQVALIVDCMDAVNVDACVRFVASLQRDDGSFSGDKWGEIDTRFSYCAVSCLALLGRLHSGEIDVAKAVEYVAQCRNFDGGFGTIPGAESHAGQTPGGGLNGRPEKLPDVCYSWWVVSSLAILNRLSWIDGSALHKFILGAQDPDDGGIADRPGDVADVYHTFFGVAGLGLTGYKGVEPVDPAFALNPAILERAGVRWKRLDEY